MRRIIAPSVLSADFGNLNRDMEMLNRSQAEWVHIDVMDGVFVPNISFGFPLMKPMRKATEKVLDVHLMITAPEKYVTRFVEAGADYVTFHYEATENIQECIDLIRNAGAKVGISIKPGTKPEVLDKWIEQLDLILVMSVEPGFGGQKFMPSSIAKCEYLSKKKAEMGLDNLIIEVDGGISAANSRLLFDAGAEALVAGSSVFGAESPEQAIVDMLNS